MYFNNFEIFTCCSIKCVFAVRYFSSFRVKYPTMSDQFQITEYNKRIQTTDNVRYTSICVGFDCTKSFV